MQQLININDTNDFVFVRNNNQNEKIYIIQILIIRDG